MPSRPWSRRKFIGAAAATGTLSTALPAFSLTPQQAPPKSQADSPEISAGRVLPLLESNVARPMRYAPAAGGFVITNGKEFFNRPLYGPNIPFRVDAGDRPEFSLYLPGHGGNLKLAISGKSGSRWLSDFATIQAVYADGRMLYELRDSILGDQGVLYLEALTQGAALWLQIKSVTAVSDLSLAFAFAGVSGRKGKRGGDIGCEVEPVSDFFQVRPEECRTNQWTLSQQQAEVLSGKFHLRLTAPSSSDLRIVDGAQWSATWRDYWGSAASPLPALAGCVPLLSEPIYLRVEDLNVPYAAQSFSERSMQLQKIAGAVTWRTPDVYLNSIAPALNIAADAIWDEAQGCVMHGAVAWRMPLAGWRGPYALDATGRHDRMQRHLRRWIARQNISPVSNGSGEFAHLSVAAGEPDKGSHNARTENLLHSNGDLSHNHYDMNLVFFDALLRHLRWTGDLAFAREAWPALVRHAAWERRLFRRVYPDGPLYEAYAAIWASDNLQYNGGGATHSSAYNVFLNRGMGELATLLGEDSSMYIAEADAITGAMRSHLWMPESGAFAESRDWLGPRSLAESPAVWTMYHTIDSEVVTPKEAWQMAAERLRNLRRIPLTGPGNPPDAWQLACSDWMPYVWSLTLLCLGENLHTALALYQARMSEAAYELLRGSLIDPAFRGLCPGNFPMSLPLDPHRQESQRDFGDPVGCASRAIIEGLWGVRPDLLKKKLVFAPQLPADWAQAHFEHPELTLTYTRDGLRESWVITSKLAIPVALHLELPARTVEHPDLLVNEQRVTAAFNPDAIGAPAIRLEAPPAATWRVEITWHGATPQRSPLRPVAFATGSAIQWPQGIHQDQVQRTANRHLAFASITAGSAAFQLPIELAPKPIAPILETHPQPGERFEPVPLKLTSQVSEIFTRPHTSPRPGLCSLNLPDTLLGGWADFDAKAVIDDAGLRAQRGTLRILNGLVFQTPAAPSAPNCTFLSYWQDDLHSLTIPLRGRARAAYLLLACSTFPQATRSLHGTANVHYSDGTSTKLELRSPQHIWPVEQDYLLDDYVFRLEPKGEQQQPLPIRVDLATARVRPLTRQSVGRKIPGGAATILRLPLDAKREMASLTLTCDLYGIQIGVLALTLGR